MHRGRIEPPSTRASWPFTLVCLAFLAAVVWLGFAAWLSVQAGTAPLPPPAPDATYPAIPAVVPLVATYATDGAGLPIVVLATPTATPEPPTPTPAAYQWPTATMVRDYSGVMAVR